MEWVVTTGRTIEEARELALDQLGVDEQDAEMEVMQEPQKGLFGRLRAEAKVRARVRPSAPPPKVDRRDRRRRERRGRDADRPGRSRNRGQGQQADRAAPGSSSSSNSTGSASRAATATATAEQGSGVGRSGSSPSRAEGGSDSSGTNQRSSRGGRRRRRGSGREGGRQQGANVVSESTTTAEATAPAFDVEAQRAAVEEFLRGLLDAFGRQEVTIAVTVVEDDTLEASIDGPDLGVLVGQKGVTLQSLQELVRSMVQRRFVGQQHARVRVDVAGYRERRRVALTRFTIDVAGSVKESGVAKALDPMGAADRKVVHDAVNEIDGVETVSEGQDASRHVVIRPSA